MYIYIYICVLARGEAIDEEVGEIDEILTCA